MAVLAEFRRKTEETRQLYASSPGAGEGNCRRFVVIDTSHSDLKVSAVPRHALTFLSVVFRGMGIHGLTLIGRGHFSEVYSCKDAGLQSAAARARRLTRTGWPHARTASTCSSRSAKSAAATCDAGLRCRVTQTGHTLRLPQPRIQGPPLSAGGAPAACAAPHTPTGAPGAIFSAAIAVGAAAAARCSARRSRRQMPPDRSQAEAVWTVRGPCWHAPTAHRWPRARVCPDSRGPWPPVRCGKTLRN